MIFNYHTPMDRDYYHDITEDPRVNPNIGPDPKKFSTAQFGQSVTEGSRFGTFIQSAQAAIRQGAVNVELGLGMGGGQESVGADSYGKEARQTLREIAKINQVRFSAVHAPVNIGNVSGFNPEQGFSEQQRLAAVEEIKKAITFSGDIAGGSAVVVHTGEFFRPMEDAAWNRKLGKKGENGYEFLAYTEEPGRSIRYLVDARTGQIQANIRKSQVYTEPIFKVAEEDHWGESVKGKRVFIRKGDWVNEDEKGIDPTDPDQLQYRVPEWDKENNRFRTRKLVWKDIEARRDRYSDQAKRYTGKDPAFTPEEVAFRVQAENSILQAKGNALFYSRNYEEALNQKSAIKKSLEHWEKLEGTVPKEQLWQLMLEDPVMRDPSLQRFVGPGEKKLPSQLLKEALKDQDRNLQYIREGAAAADARAAEVEDSLRFIVPMEKYALRQTARSYAELGVQAWQESRHNKNAKRDIFLAPENIFPEMGYGSHPTEIIDIVKNARKEMVKLMTSPKVEDPHGRWNERGELPKVPNPFYHKNVSEQEAQKLAEKHIKATLDTQHLGMWRKYFQPKYVDGEGRLETPQETDKRFNNWYMEQIRLMEKEKVLGHVHLVDAFGSGHQHLPAGQGSFPVIDAVKYLRERGYAGAITSEGYGEAAYGPERILSKVWEAFDANTQMTSYATGAPGGGGRFGQPSYWSGVSQSYFGKMIPPYFIFGAYSPSNEWKLWSEVPLE